jgi:hypothetical protein
MDPITGVSPQNTTTSAINPLLLLGLAAAGDVSPITGSTDIGALAGVGATGLDGAASSQVELSGLGLLVSALDGFQTQTAAVQQAMLTDGSAAPAFAQVATAAQQLVDSFNNLQNTAGALNNGPLGPFATAPVTTQLTNQLDTVAQGTFDAGAPGLNSLAAIGITSQASPGGGLAIDLNALQSAYQRNAAGVASVLSQAAQGFNGLAANYVGAGGSLTGLLDNLQQNVLTTDLFTVGSVSAAGSLFLALNTLPQAQMSPQQANAIRQYAQVAAMAQQSQFEVSALLGT